MFNQAIKEIENYLYDIKFSTTIKRAEYPSNKTLEFCLDILRNLESLDLIKREDVKKYMISPAQVVDASGCAIGIRNPSISELEVRLAEIPKAIYEEESE